MFVQLTSAAGLPIWINPDHVTSIAASWELDANSPSGSAPLADRVTLSTRSGRVYLRGEVDAIVHALATRSEVER